MGRQFQAVPAPRGSDRLCDPGRPGVQTSGEDDRALGRGSSWEGEKNMEKSRGEVVWPYRERRVSVCACLCHSAPPSVGTDARRPAAAPQRGVAPLGLSEAPPRMPPWLLPAVSSVPLVCGLLSRPPSSHGPSSGLSVSPEQTRTRPPAGCPPFACALPVCLSRGLSANLHPHAPKEGAFQRFEKM